MKNSEFAAVIAAVLRTARLRASSEAALQASIAEALHAAKVVFERERSLGPKDRPDFLLAAGAVVIEAKARYPKKAIYRQLARYAEHAGVDAIILVTGTAMGMPAMINEKPIHVVPLGLGTIGC